MEKNHKIIIALLVIIIVLLIGLIVSMQNFTNSDAEVEANDTTAVINETTNLKEFQDVPEETPLLSKNEQILLLYKEGKDEVEIAKTLDCGLGEVRLVLGLYNNEA